MKYRVIAADHTIPYDAKTETHECECLTDAFKKLGELAPHNSGVILIDEQDTVWAEIRSAGNLKMMTAAQSSYYQLYTKKVILTAEQEAAAKIKTFCETFFDKSGQTMFPTFREVSKATRIPIYKINEILESHDYGMGRTYYNCDWDKIPDGDFFLEVY